MYTKAEKWKICWYCIPVLFSILFIIGGILYYESWKDTLPTRENRIMYARQLSLTSPLSVIIHADMDDDTVLVVRGTCKTARYEAFIERLKDDNRLLCKMGFTRYDIRSLCLVNPMGETICSSQDQEIELVCPPQKEHIIKRVFPPRMDGKELGNVR